MYILVLGAVLLSLCIVAVERRRGSPAGGLIGVITLSFACFGLVTGLFWVFFPGSPPAWFRAPCRHRWRRGSCRYEARSSSRSPSSSW